MESTYTSATDEKQRVPDSTRVFRSSARIGLLQGAAPLRTSIVLRARKRRPWEESEDDPHEIPGNADNVAARVERSSDELAEKNSAKERRSGQTSQTARRDKTTTTTTTTTVKRERPERRKTQRISEEPRVTNVQPEENRESPEQILWERLERDLQNPTEKKERKTHEQESTVEEQRGVEYGEKIRERRSRKSRVAEDNPSDRTDKKQVSTEEKTRERRAPRKETEGLESTAGNGIRTLLSRRSGKSRRSSAGRRCPASSSTSSSSSSSLARRNPMTMDLQRLIDEVHARPAIWDQKNVNYHNREVIFKMWREIARACEVSTEVAKSKWKHLRDNFRNELKKTYRGKCDGGVIIGGVGCNVLASEHDSKWVWFKSLFFLREQMNSRVIGCGLPQTCGPGIQSSPDETQIEPQIDIVEGHEQARFDDDLDGDGSCQSMLSNEDGLHRTMPPPKPSKLSRKRTLLEAIDEDYAEVERKRYESVQKRLVAEQLEKDDTYHFLMSVRNPLRSLPLDRQMFVRLKIQELVYNEINSQNQHGSGYEATDVKPPRPGGNRNSENDDVSADIRNSLQETNSNSAFFG